MFGLAVIPGVALVIGFLVMPESARWLLKMGRRDEARASLLKVDGPEIADQGLATLETDKATLYAVGATNVLATFVAVAWVDRFGRRPLLFTGLVGMAVSLAAVGLSFAALENQPPDAGTSTSVGGIVTVFALVVFIASFAFSMGPIVWTLISEIYPNRVRGRAIAVATAFNWFSAFIVAQFFLSIVDAIGEATTFFVFSALCVVTYVFVRRYVPETKGRSLEEIQERWVLKGDRMLEDAA
jgi:MFS family permease